jgi:hypothetical protein
VNRSRRTARKWDYGRLEGIRSPPFAGLMIGRPGVRFIPLTATFVALAALSQTIAAAQNAPAFQFTEKPGPYSVGLRVIQQYDRSGVFRATSDARGESAAEAPRPLQTLVWYPAEASAARRMNVGDYAALILTETRFDKPTSDGNPQSFVENFTHGTTSTST